MIVFLQKEKSNPFYHLRHGIQTWQTNFDIESDNLVDMLDRSLSSESAGRLWGGGRHSIKSGLIELAQHSPWMMKATFVDLYNEKIETSMRLSRFLFHCEQIFSEIKSDVRKINTHHQSYYSASLFLSLQCPHEAIPIQYEDFSQLMTRLESHNIPTEHETERYFKLCKALAKVIQKDTDFMEQYYQLLDEESYLGPTIAIVWELMEFQKSV